ncbi:MAG TPA: hypothetical protein VJ728_05615 [Candidatus Binataceae bacterium]|nr:hypothetical protein [Candidatus Binataceae bacterium]
MTISIVLYGRNDNYGYNLHKRAALSLNCMADILSDPSDEIIFVDYNTPDDFPTFPEAIQDTLTKAAKEKLRILRVRPRIHARFKSKTHLLALEPIARNVAVRRSNSENRWILSTNTDMIFVPQIADTISNVVKDLSAGYYHAPRIEIPEVLWESLDRSAPGHVIATVRDWGSNLHLNEIILGADFIRYDGPGDFQLLLRDDLFENQGFHEGMLLGWHVDSNVAKRMYIKYGVTGDLAFKIYGYHCDHTRQVTPAHNHIRVQNDWRRFCHEVDRPDIPEQASTWGCPNDPIEEVRLVTDPASVYVQALREAIGAPLTEPQVNRYTLETFNKTDYDPRHMVPFLADMFATMPKNSNLVWYGIGEEMLSRFAAVWDKLGFVGNISLDPELTKANEFTEATSPDLAPSNLDVAHVLVFDFGGLPGAPSDLDRQQLSAKLLQRFVAVVHDEQRRMLAGLPPRRIIALNAINNQFEHVVRAYVAAAATPCATHMRHGFVIPIEAKDDWLPFLHIGQAGSRIGSQLDTDPLRLGVIAYGPYRYLDGGLYRLTIDVTRASNDVGEGVGTEPCVVIEVHSGAEVFAVFPLSRSVLTKSVHDFIFELPSRPVDLTNSIETRIISLGRVALSIHSLIVEVLSESNRRDADASLLYPSFALNIRNWLPYLSLGPLGRANGAGVTSQSGPAAFVIFGPYWPLPAGRYELIIDFEYDNRAPLLEHMVIRADVTTGEQQLVTATFRLDQQHVASKIRLPFEMSGTASAWRQVETRIWSSGEEYFRITSISVNALEDSTERDLLPFLLVGDAGRRVPAGLSSIEGRNGVVAFSPSMQLSSGSYQLTLSIAVDNASQVHEDGQGSIFALVKEGAEILDAKEIAVSTNQIEEHKLFFTVQSISDPKSSLEFFFQVLRAPTVRLCGLTIEAADTTPQRRAPAVLTLRDWLPFLRTGKSAHSRKSGIFIAEGVEEFVLYGPFWALPAGQYEMRAMVVPNPHGKQHSTFVTAQIAGEEGTRIFAECKWPLSLYKLTNPAAAVEFRLPFSLSSDLSVAARTIEARIFTHGQAAFDILSLSVLARDKNFEGDWFPYLIVQEGGVHSGAEIRSAESKFDYVASTPRIPLLPGHYKISPTISIDTTSRHSGELSFELWSGTELFAVAGADGKRDHPIDFDVPTELNERAFELRIRSLTSAEFAIRRVEVEKVSDLVDPAWQERLARAQSRRRLTLMQAQLTHGEVKSVVTQLFRAAIARLTKHFGTAE